MKIKIFETFIPAETEFFSGVLYVSRLYETSIHICPCGCGMRAVCQTGEGGWSLDESTVTLSPSILNRNCKAHYWIRNGEIVWAEPPPQRKVA